MDEAKSRILGAILAKTDQRVTARHWLLDDGDPPAPAVLLIIHEEFIVWRAKEVELSTRWRGTRDGTNRSSSWIFNGAYPLLLPRGQGFLFTNNKINERRIYGRDGV